MRARRKLAAICVAALLGPALGIAEAEAKPKQRPNVVMIVTDDQPVGTFTREVMPNTFRLLVDRGVNFSEAVVSTPQCCPSRATTITGQYPHNNGVEANRPGYPTLERKSNTLPVWLQRAGYRTIHIGKYLNGYTGAMGTRPAPGWDGWLSLMLSHYSSPNFSVNGVLEKFPEQHLTDVISGMSVSAIERNIGRKRPLYLQVDHFAPHVGPGDRTGSCEGAAVPAPEDAGQFAAAPVPRPPSFGEPDTVDKPGYISRLPRFSGADIAEIDRRYRCALGSLVSVDRSVEAITAALERAGELDETLIIFTSDNGYAYGEHRMQTGKGLPYEEHIRVPLVIRPPDRKRFRGENSRGRITRAMVGNVDLAPTVLAMAGGTPCRGKRAKGCRRLDGRPLLGLVAGRDPGWSKKRALRIGFYINAERYSLSCRWQGFRSAEQVVIRHTELPDPGSRDECRPAGLIERYDRAEDPFQLEAETAPLDDATFRRLSRAVRCSGIRGRDPRLEKIPFCE